MNSRILKIEVDLQILDRGVDLLAEGDAVELVEHGLVEALDDAVGLVERFEWHYTPKHGSWLDLAESELGVLASRCLDRRIPDKKTITDAVAAWVRERNKIHAGAQWHFSTDDARVKLRSLYPST